MKSKGIADHKQQLDELPESQDVIHIRALHDGRDWISEAETGSLITDKNDIEQVIKAIKNKTTKVDAFFATPPLAAYRDFEITYKKEGETDSAIFAFHGDDRLRMNGSDHYIQPSHDDISQLRNIVQGVSPGAIASESSL